jgi:hypothetical protein
VRVNAIADPAHALLADLGYEGEAGRVTGGEAAQRRSGSVGPGPCSRSGGVVAGRWSLPRARAWLLALTDGVGAALKRSAIALARGVRTGQRRMRMLAPLNTASRAAVNVLSRSRIRK